MIYIIYIQLILIKVIWGEECDYEKRIFERQHYYGRISYYDITFNLGILSQDCDD